MRTTIGLLTAALLLPFPAATAVAKGRPFEGAGNGRHALPWTLERGSSVVGDLPTRAPEGGSRADTFSFGYAQLIGGQLYAVPGEVWTFDHGAGGPEGWYAVDLSVPSTAPGRRITAELWAGHDNAVEPPIPSGGACLWFGTFEDEADALCWSEGLGYGSGNCQKWRGPEVGYLGSGAVSLSFAYFNNTEPLFDFTRVRLEFPDGTVLPLNGPGFDGVIGDPSADSYATFSTEIAETELAGHAAFRLVFVFTSDGAWSDEDGSYPTEFGPFGADDIALSGPGLASPIGYDFEIDQAGWTAIPCASAGSLFGIASVSDYTILDACDCALSGNILEMHEGVGDSGVHLDRQHEMAFSPPADKSGIGGACAAILAEWDQYSIQPQANGVFHRPGWNYYPWICPETGSVGWSGRVGESTYHSTGSSPDCFRSRDVATSWGVPGSAELVSFVWEVYSSCDAFGIPPSVCTNITNATPLIDNVRILVTAQACAPVVTFDPGAYLQDGYGMSQFLSTTNAGNADVTYDLSRDSYDADQLGDSLLVRGPTPTSSTRWESRLYWRVRREGPGQAAAPGYLTWRNAIADGLEIVGPGGAFAVGLMDSAQHATGTYRDRMISEFREDDDDFAGEGTNDNEMIRDGILRPGTQVEYFIASNYTCTPDECFLLPDTAGGTYLEFEILPRWRSIDGISKYPCTLLIDLNNGEQSLVEDALNVVLHGAGVTDPVPDLPFWDRYDYADAESNWNAPLARSIGGNNGLPLLQIMGYRLVVLAAGSARVGAMETSDFTLFSEWFSTKPCNGNTVRQGFIGSGDNLAQMLSYTNPAFMVNALGVGNSCDAYHEPGCGPSSPPDESWCVRVEPGSNALFAPLVAYDLFGNWCPQMARFDVLQAVGGGVGNRVYQDQDRVPPLNTNYAQVARSVTGSNSDNYRSVLSGYSFGRMTARDPEAECTADATVRITAVSEELRAATQWIFGGGGGTPSVCTEPCGCCTDVDQGPVVPMGVSHLYANAPNPFNPRTTLRFAVAAAGPAELLVFDVSGRRVRTLVDSPVAAGEHSAVWDGTDDSGRRVPAGIYWSQLRTGGYESQRKMIVMR